MSRFIFVIEKDPVDLTSVQLYMWEEFENVYSLITEFGHPEVTLCGWRGIKIQVLPN